MAKTERDKLSDLISGLDPGTLCRMIMDMADEFGVKKFFKVAKKAADSCIVVDFDTIKKWTVSALNEDEEYFFRNLGRDEYRDYIDPGEHASEMIEERIKDNFYDDVKALFVMKRTDDVETYIKAIAAGLRECDSILCEWAVDFPGEYADHMEKCLDKGKPLEGFDW